MFIFKDSNAQKTTTGHRPRTNRNTRNNRCNKVQQFGATNTIDWEPSLIIDKAINKNSSTNAYFMQIESPRKRILGPSACGIKIYVYALCTDNIWKKNAVDINLEPYQFAVSESFFGSVRVRPEYKWQWLHNTDHFDRSDSLEMISHYIYIYHFIIYILAKR